MKTFRLLAAVSFATLIIWNYPQIVIAQTAKIPINSLMQKDPIILTGSSGGSQLSKCGYLNQSPNYVFQIQTALPYLRLTIESQGKPTLSVDGPGGKFCVLTDNYTHEKPEFSGYWPAGEYSIYVGESSAQSSDYTLLVSQQRKPKNPDHH